MGGPYSIEPMQSPTTSAQVRSKSSTHDQGTDFKSSSPPVEHYFPHKK